MIFMCVYVCMHGIHVCVCVCVCPRHIKFEVDFPSSLTQDQKELVKKLFSA